MNKSPLPLVSLLYIASLLPLSHGLSWAVCEQGGSSWVTERPYTGDVYPGANLWFSCLKGLNIVGKGVHPCFNSGELCLGVPDAVCKLMGYDLVYGSTTAVRAKRDEVVRSLTGEYCLREGVYSSTVPDDLKDLPGEPCLRIDSITCIRTIASMSAVAEEIIANATATPEPTPTPTPPNNRKLLTA